MPVLASGILGNGWLTIVVAFAIILTVRAAVGHAQRDDRDRRG